MNEAAKNVVPVHFNGSREAFLEEEEGLVQYDYGQILKFEDIELPTAYTVHFGNEKEDGLSKPMIGDETGVEIPAEFLQTGLPVWAWIFLHEGQDDGETEYIVKIPVKRRSRPTNYAPTEIQQSAIDQAIAALNTAVEDAEEAKAAAEAAQGAAAASATAAGGSASAAAVSATAAEGSAAAAGASAGAAAAAEQGAEAAKRSAEQTVAGAVETINTAKNQAVAAVQGEGTTQIGNVNTAGQNQIAAVQQAGAEQTAAARAQAEAAAQSAAGANSAKEAAIAAKEAAQAAAQEAASVNKADKVTGATAGHVAALDASGNLTDNGNKYQPVPKDDTMVIRVGADTAGRLWASGDSGAERFGVQGVGGSSTTLTRLWDAVGLTAAPGTDQVAAQSDFDAFAVFNRRKCVGSWSLQNDKPVFTVQAYEGDADYAEDGSMGDYVAVDVPPTYWYHDEENGILGVSGNAHPGWEPHPVCVDENGDVRAHTYIPVYPLALDGNGNAVSLPGYDPYFGAFKAVWDACKTYGDGSLANCVILEPSVVDHYEWLMMTIEFATTNMQTVMQGAVSMPYAASHTITAAPGANKIVLTAAIGDTCSIGQTLYIGSDHGATPSNVSAYNHITAIEKCDEDGTLNDSGTYRLITYDGTDRTASITPGTTKIGSRPWITGATAGFAPGVQPVLGHTGSPVSNSDARHPMRYRWRENVYGNINITALDLFNARTADGSSYHLDWYYNDRLRYEGPTLYYPSSASKPDLTDLQNAEKGFRKLSTTTPVASYKDGFIKEEGFDADLPCVRVPTLTTGGSATTYFADYASLVTSSAVRAVRRRGTVHSGAFSGPRYVVAIFAPSYGYWSYGAALYMVQ